METTASYGKSITWVFCLGSGPVLCLFWFCCLLCFSAGETQVWLGDLRVVVLCCFLWLCVGLIDLPDPMDLCPCTNFFLCLRSYKDRAFSATSATLEEKKEGMISTRLENMRKYDKYVDFR